MNNKKINNKQVKEQKAKEIATMGRTFRITHGKKLSVFTITTK